MEKEGVVYLKIFGRHKGDIVFEGKVSTDVYPEELVKLRCFWSRCLFGIYNKARNKEVMSFKGLQNDVELVAGSGVYKSFSGVLYVGSEDGVLRKSDNVPSCECVMMSIWYLWQEECEKVFKRDTLEELEMFYCGLRQIPKEIGKMKKLKKLTLYGLFDLKSLPEEMGELTSLEELRIEFCEIKILPKKLKDLRLKSASFKNLHHFCLHEDYLVMFSKLKYLRIRDCVNVFNPSFTRVFWNMIKSTTDLRVLELNWKMDEVEMVSKVLEENGSIVDGVWCPDSYLPFFKRNIDNHKKTLQCVLHLLAIRRCRIFHNHIPKEMFYMLGLSLWNTKCDVESWT